MASLKKLVFRKYNIVFHFIDKETEGLPTATNLICDRRTEVQFP